MKPDIRVGQASPAILFLCTITLGCGGGAGATGDELPLRLVPGFFSAAEAYFSPDGTHLVLNARLNEQEAEYHVYTTNLDGTEIRQINDRGEDACSFFFPDGDRLVFTSTRDNPDLPKGDYSRITDYPTGAELYSCRLDGSDVRRLTHNQLYEAEVSVSPDGEWILFGRLVEGRMELWRMRPDGSGEFQITDTPEWQEGGAFYLPDSEHILFRAWRREDQGSSPLPMTLFTIKHDGTDLTQLTHDDGTNWAPYPSPDGKHLVFVKVPEPHNYEVFLMNMETGKQTRVTHNAAFDGFPAFAPDGRTIAFASNRGQEPQSGGMSVYLMDVGPLLED
jgi:TolB protein